MSVHRPLTQAPAGNWWGRDRAFPAEGDRQRFPGMIPVKGQPMGNEFLEEHSLR